MAKGRGACQKTENSGVGDRTKTRKMWYPNTLTEDSISRRIGF